MSVSIKTTRRASDQKVVRGNLSLYVSPTGNDNSNGKTATTPFRTISKAFSFIKGFYIADDANVTINVASGVYNIASELVMDHPQGNRITLKGPSSLVQTARSAKNYIDTTSLTGRVNRLSYATYNPFMTSEVVSSPTTGGRFINTISYDGDTGVPSNTTGNYVMVSPHDITTGIINLQHNLNSLDNYSTFGFSANSSAPNRYNETESSMRRFFSLGGFRIKTNSRDVTNSSNEIVVENYRNRNPYEGVSNTATGRVHTLSDPSDSSYNLGGVSGAPSQYISAVINARKTNGIRITNGSSLTVEYLAIETNDPSTSTPSSSSGILAENDSTVVLGTAVVIKNFKIGISARNKSAIRQVYNGTVPFNSTTYCGTGILASENSQVTLNSFVSNGSWDTGFSINQQSEGTFTDCVAVGSGTDGFVAARNSNLVAIRCVAAYNFQEAATNYTSEKQGGIGFGSRLTSNAECVSCLSFRNGFGYLTDKNASINLSGCDSMDNINRGVSITECSTGVVGPFVHSDSDAASVSVCDNSFARGYVIACDLSGLDPANGLSPGNGILVATNSCLNVFDCQVSSFGNNAIETVYNSFVVADNLSISGSGNGDQINCKYNGSIRCSSSTIETSSIYTTGLQSGFAEVNGVAY